ncbi:MAG: hypothetical protein GEU78_18130 [Actinobacteria bacterium]|nr:hypothetical protein [Actinomycetota bacterium]
MDTQVTDVLREAYRSGMPIPPPSREQDLSINDAYGTQLNQVRAWTADGTRAVRRKMGCSGPRARNRCRIEAEEREGVMS